MIWKFTPTITKLFTSVLQVEAYGNRMMEALPLTLFLTIIFNLLERLNWTQMILTTPYMLGRVKLGREIVCPTETGYTKPQMVAQIGKKLVLKILNALQELSSTPTTLKRFTLQRLVLYGETMKSEVFSNQLTVVLHGKKFFM